MFDSISAIIHFQPLVQPTSTTNQPSNSTKHLKNYSPNMKFCNLRFVILCSAAALLLIALHGIEANPVVVGGSTGPHGGGFGGGFAVGRSIAVGPGGQVKTGGFGPFIGGLPFFFRRR